MEIIYPPILDYYKTADIDLKFTNLSAQLTLQDLTTSGNIVDWTNATFIIPARLTTTSGDIVAQIPSLVTYSTIAKLTTTSGDIVAQIPSLLTYATITKLTTTSGDIISQIPSLAGYATQGWVSSGFTTPSMVLTTSGDIVSQIPSLANYITLTKLTTTSGDIISQIPSLLNYVTLSKLTTASGDIVSQIPSLSGYATQTWVGNQNYATQSWASGQFVTPSTLITTSGDIVSQIPSLVLYSTLAKLTTTSGDIISQIPSLSGYATQSWSNSTFIDTGEMTTISGDLVAQMGEGGISLEQLTTTSGDIVAQFGEVTGASESWVNSNFIDNEEMTTISGDIVSALGTGSIGTRTTAVATATSLSAGANSYQTFTMAKSFSLIGVSVDNKKCRVQLYVTSAARTADVARGFSVPLALGKQHGCIADFYFDQYYAVDPWICSPPIMGANMDTTPSTNIYATITNMGLTEQTIAVTLTYTPTES